MKSRSLFSFAALQCIVFSSFLFAVDISSEFTSAEHSLTTNPAAVQNDKELQTKSCYCYCESTPGATGATGTNSPIFGGYLNYNVFTNSNYFAVPFTVEQVAPVGGITQPSTDQFLLPIAGTYSVTWSMTVESGNGLPTEDYGVFLKNITTDTQVQPDPVQLILGNSSRIFTGTAYITVAADDVISLILAFVNSTSIIITQPTIHIQKID